VNLGWVMAELVAMNCRDSAIFAVS
jgi:hypothetical protein